MPADKRVIGLPGDTLAILPGDAGTPPRVAIRAGGQGPWQQLVEPYLNSAPWTALDSCCIANGSDTLDGKPQVVTIPTGDLFVLGDNRNVSNDSRLFGWLPLAAVTANVVSRSDGGSLYARLPSLAACTSCSVLG